jgi:mRNA interferase MazF
MAKVSPPPAGTKPKVTGLRRGDICLCSFDPTVGHEIRKTRPALVIQNDVGNQFSSLTIVAAISSSSSSVLFPVEVTMDRTDGNGLDVRSSIRLDQIRTVDRQRLVRRLGRAEAAVMAKVDQALKISLGLISI